MKFGQRIFQRGGCIDKIPSNKLCLLFYEAMDDGRIHGWWMNPWTMGESMDDGRIHGWWMHPWIHSSLFHRFCAILFRQILFFRVFFPTGPTQILDALLKYYSTVRTTNFTRTQCWSTRELRTQLDKLCLKYEPPALRISTLSARFFCENVSENGALRFLKLRLKSE